MERATTTYVDAIRCEHRVVNQKSHQLELALQEAVARNWPPPLVAALGDRLVDLEQCLERHFAREEEGGFLDEAVAEAPRYAHESDRLMHEHTEILARVREMISHLKHYQALPAPPWYAFARSLEALLRQLMMHETTENAILKKAFNLDVDVVR